MSLNLAMGHLLMHVAKTDSQLSHTFGRALEIAEHVGLTTPHAEALAGAWLGSTRCADYPKALELAERFRRDCAATGQVDKLVYDRMVALPLHYMGKFGCARHFIECALEQPLGKAQATHDRLFYVDLQVAMYAIHARNCWCQGFADQARDAAGRSLERAVSLNSATGVCYALVVAACPVAIWTGDLAEARGLTSMLFEYSSRYSLDSWGSWVPFYEGVLLSKSVGPDELEEITTQRTAALDTIQIDALATLQEGDVPAEALARVESGRVGWNAAEILRVSGERARKNIGPEAEGMAEAAYLRSLDIARRQAALSWQLRTAMSLAHLWRDQHRTREARELLAGVHGRFTEGHHTADYMRAGVLLEELSATR